MYSKSKQVSEEKENLHPRNPHRSRYDFPTLAKNCPDLALFVIEDGFQNLTIDFSDQKAVKNLNKALLKTYYGISLWDIPEGYLCPPIPGRADYIHYAADILAENNNGEIPKGKKVKVLDVGVGANCIYPLIGLKAYGWHFVGSDIDQGAINSAKNIINANELSKALDIRLQKSADYIFKGIIKPTDFFELTICNPPFHSSLTEAMAGTERKWKNLEKSPANNAKLNFGGKNAELWCEGGEAFFIKKMIDESALFSENVGFFTTLVSKKTTLPNALKQLEKLKAINVKVINMAQGQKVSRLLAWNFLNKAEQNNRPYNR